MAAKDDTVGGVASRLTDPDTLPDTFVVPPSGVTVTSHEYDWPVVSLVTLNPLQPLSLQNDSPVGTFHENETFTSPVNQPPQPPPGLHETDTTGATRSTERAAPEPARTREKVTKPRRAAPDFTALPVAFESSHRCR